MSPFPLARKLLRRAAAGGLAPALRKAWLHLASGGDPYGLWVRRYDTLTGSDRARIRSAVAEMSAPPLLSVVMPVYNPPERWLREAIESVRAQLYPHWELCIADDASTASHVRIILEEAVQSDERIRVRFRECNGHISAATNSALEMASGAHVAFLDHDDLFAENALYEVARALVKDPALDLIYSDEDKVDEQNRRHLPHFKPDWSPTLLLGQNYVTHLAVYRTALVRELGGMRVGLEGSQDWDLLLRAAERLSPGRVRHIPRVLYHWRVLPGSTAAGLDAKDYALNAGQRAIEDALQRRGTPGIVTHVPGEYFHTQFGLPAHREGNADAGALPTVTVISDGISPALLAALDYPFMQAVSLPRWEPRAMNDAVERAEDGWVLMLRAGLWPDPGALRGMLGHAIQTGVGAVGARLVRADGSTHASGIVGSASARVAVGAFAGLPPGDVGYMCRDRLAAEWSAVDGSALLIRRSTFLRLGGYASDEFPALYDVDLCLRLWEAGQRVVCAPRPRFRATAALPRHALDRTVTPAERKAFRSRWPRFRHPDPYYSPNLDPSHGTFDLAFPPQR